MIIPAVRAENAWRCSCGTQRERMQLLFSRPADFFNKGCVVSQGHRCSVRRFGAALWREPIFNRAAYDAQNRWWASRLKFRWVLMQFERGTRILRVVHGRDARAASANCLAVVVSLMSDKRR